jgi:GAF domain-containing protein
VTQLTSDQYLQYIALFLALVEVIVGLYILVLNRQHIANRHVGIFLLLSAVNTYAVGLMITAQTAAQAEYSAVILAMTTSATEPLLLVTSVSLLRPQWLRNRFRWIWLPAYGFALLPVVLTSIDLLFGTRTWYTGIDANTYTGGFLITPKFTEGYLSALVRAGFIFSFIVILVLLVYIGKFDKKSTPKEKKLAWILLFQQFVTGAILTYFAQIILPAVTILITNTIFVITYAFAAFEQMISERSKQPGSLQSRLIAVILIVSIPALIASTAFIVDYAQRTLKAINDQDLTSTTRQLQSATQQGDLGAADFGDAEGQSWQSQSGLPRDEWAAGTQIPASQLEAPLQVLRNLAWVTLAAAIFILSVLSILMIRQSLRPVRTLTQVASAVAAGDLTQVAPIESEDEIGLLARSFNSMTHQVRELVGDLEKRVAQRTQDLQRRAVQLQVAAEVAQEAASILDVNQLLTHTVNLISNRFDFYHAGIFLIDAPQEYAVLASASSEGGRKMLARGHKLKVGQVGIVGYVAGKGEPRIALDVGKDAMYFDNPDLPLTRSELALPMKARGEVIGVLDVQSVKAATFTEEDSAILQILADQIALAIENARLLQSSEHSLKELETLYMQQVEQAWEQRLQNQVIAYSYDRMGVHPSPLNLASPETQIPDENNPNSDRTISIPIRLRNITLGALELNRDSGSPPWNAEEINLIEECMSQVSLALEGSRLKELERKRIQKEQLISQISAQTQSALDLETVMKRAVLGIGQTLKAERVQIELKYPETESSPSGNGAHE